jgi:hypothetical protein
LDEILENGEKKLKNRERTPTQKIRLSIDRPLFACVWIVFEYNAKPENDHKSHSL